MVPFAASIFTVNDLGFNRMKFKSTGLKALFQYVQHVLGFRLATAMHQTIIGVATPWCIRVMIFQPFIEYIVQKQITEHGADNPTLWSAFVPTDQLSIGHLHRRR